ncbi:HAD family hydrolase [Raineya orbicola]|jgi:putative hydrolase of the HAD superfamily|uniref:HAD-SF-IA-v3: HAD hydrolase, family IA, variant 3 n=1 Tax=Raineya orbicola TaxID=2016530 RepID=A0A2N3IJS3_9BACT|nr:HAD family phosphatase [Raineya orbicola]PKQ70557.1 HAD-SF-IA-v3: HAD hydrolase, family IA, variant 3 [Raineya orbicola]
MQEKKVWVQNLLQNGLEAIIFDLGGVIIDIDFNLTIKELENYTTHQFGEGEYLTKHPIFYEFETGKIGEITFFTEIRKIFGLNATLIELEQAWNALLLDIPQKRVDLLRKLQKELPTFILSNTNPTHLEEVENILRRQTDAQTLKNLVKKPYYSFEVGKAKPETAIYEIVLKENKLNPEKTLFIDDSLRNLEGAKKVGLQTLHITPFAEDICDFFSEYSKK